MNFYRESLIHEPEFKDYKEAGQKILNGGEYVPNLLSLIKEEKLELIEGYYPTDVIVTFVLDIENKINYALLKKDDEKVKNLEKEYEKVLNRSRNEVVSLVKDILNEPEKNFFDNVIVSITSKFGY